MKTPRRAKSADGDGDDQGSGRSRQASEPQKNCIYGGAFPLTGAEAGMSGDFLPKLEMRRP